MFSKLSYMRCNAKRYLLLIFFHILFIPANAVLPLEHYRQAAEESKIKAIATITQVETMSIDKYASLKKVTFKLEYEFTKKRSSIISKTYSILRKIAGSETRQIFSGLCKSVDTTEQKKNIMAGGTIYFYPRVGSRVFVTISEDGGSITTLTTMTPKLEKAIYETPEKLKFRMGNIYISK